MIDNFGSGDIMEFHFYMMDEENRVLSINSTNMELYPTSIQEYIKQLKIQRLNETNNVVEGNNYILLDTYDP
jgi:hypothetical protein